MPKEKSLAKEHTSTIPDQEVEIPSSYEESASSDHESENEVSFNPSQITSSHSSFANHVHTLH